MAEIDFTQTDRLVYVAEKLIADKDYEFLAKYPFRYLSFGSGTSLYKGIWKPYAGDPLATTENLIRCIPKDYPAILEFHSHDTLEEDIINKVCNIVKNNLYLAVCIDKLVETFSTGGLNGMHTWPMTGFDTKSNFISDGANFSIYNPSDDCLLRVGVEFQNTNEIETIQIHGVNLCDVTIHLYKPDSLGLAHPLIRCRLCDIVKYLKNAINKVYYGVQ